MHRFRSILTVALLVVVAPMSFAPAAAGGPTSALLSVPGEGATASLYYTDPDYDALAGLVGIESSTGVGAVDTAGVSHETGPGITVTWLIHDVTPWRVDRIYLEGKGAPWIATQLLGDSGTAMDSPVVWHQPAAGAKLAALLDELGVGEASRDAGEFTGVAGAPVPPPVEPVAEEPAPAEPAATASGLTGIWWAEIWWALGGLVLGVLATVVWMRPRRGKAARTDATPAADHDRPCETAPVAGEELLWPAPRS